MIGGAVAEAMEAVLVEFFRAPRTARQSALEAFAFGVRELEGGA